MCILCVLTAHYYNNEFTHAASGCITRNRFSLILGTARRLSVFCTATWRNNTPLPQPVCLFFSLSSVVPSIVAGCSFLLWHYLVGQSLYLTQRCVSSRRRWLTLWLCMMCNISVLYVRELLFGYFCSCPCKCYDKIVSLVSLLHV